PPPRRKRAKRRPRAPPAILLTRAAGTHPAALLTRAAGTHPAALLASRVETTSARAPRLPMLIRSQVFRPIRRQVFRQVRPPGGPTRAILARRLPRSALAAADPDFHAARVLVVGRGDVRVP